MLVNLKTKNAINVMDGNSYIEKAINYYLTNTFISNVEAPSDECLSYAQDFVNNNYTEKQIAFILFYNFGTRFTVDDEFDYCVDGPIYDICAKEINNIIEVSKKISEVKVATK